METKKKGCLLPLMVVWLEKKTSVHEHLFGKRGPINSCDLLVRRQGQRARQQETESDKQRLEAKTNKRGGRGEGGGMRFSQFCSFRYGTAQVPQERQPSQQTNGSWCTDVFTAAEAALLGGAEIKLLIDSKGKTVRGPHRRPGPREPSKGGFTLFGICRHGDEG